MNTYDMVHDVDTTTPEETAKYGCVGEYVKVDDILPVLKEVDEALRMAVSRWPLSRAHALAKLHALLTQLDPKRPTT